MFYCDVPYEGCSHAQAFKFGCFSSEDSATRTAKSVIDKIENSKHSIPGPCLFVPAYFAYSSEP